MILVSLVLRRFLRPSCRSEVVLGGPGRSLGVWGGLGGMWGALWDLFETSRGGLGGRKLASENFAQARGGLGPFWSISDRSGVVPGSSGQTPGGVNRKGET